MGAHQRSRRSRRAKQRTVVVLLALLPALVMGGMLAPGFVRGWKRQPQPPPPRIPKLERPLKPRPTLLIPRDFTSGFARDLLHLDQLFLQTRYTPDAPRRYEQLVGFPRSFGDTIVLDDVDRFVPGILFKDALVASLAEPTFEPLYRPYPLNGALPLSPSFRRVTQLPVAPSVIPEPGTAPLLGVGLAYLAARRRARRARVVLARP